MKLVDVLANVKNYGKKHTLNAERQIFSFALIMLINFPLYYFIWTFTNKVSYENLPLRLLASFLCFLLIFHAYWPKKLKEFLPLCWYITILYCLPFFFTFMTLKNHASTLWLMNCVSVAFFMILLLDFLSFFFILCTGVSLGYLFFDFSTSFFYYDPGEVNLSGIFATIVAAIIIGGIFSHNKEIIEQAKIKSMTALSATMAHELRTPLLAISMGISGAKGYLPSLVKAYTKAKAHNLDVDPIRPSHLEILENVFNDIESEVRYSNTIINMMLMNVKQEIMSTVDFKMYSMLACVEATIARYPFKQGEKELVVFNRKSDFLFYGDNTLMAHILFNLLKNALYYIQAAQKGKVEIWCETEGNDNVLYFKDTGKGIPEDVMQKLFEKFYTTTHHGTGLGLAFCKMVMTSFGGNISCTSKYGEFTQFKMIFPKKESTL